MNARPIQRIQTLFEHAACVLLAGAVAFAVYEVLNGMLGARQLGIAAGCCGVVTYLLCSRVLVSRSFELPDFGIRPFDVAELEFTEAEELVLTDADRLEVPADQGQQEPLILDDILAEIGPDSRVVRLFDRKAMPTPGNLKSRIGDHLEQGRSASAPHDASQALSDALAELRRSLR